MQDERDEELPARLRVLQGFLAVVGVLQGGVQQPRSEICLHEAVREPDAVPAQLDKLQLGGPGRSQPHVYGPNSGCPPRLLVDLHKSPLHFCGDLVANGVVELDVKPVVSEPDAGERRHMLDRRVPFGSVKRNVFVEVAPYERPFPCLQQSQPQRGPVGATSVNHAVLACRGGLQQAFDVQLTGDLQV